MKHFMITGTSEIGYDLTLLVIAETPRRAYELFCAHYFDGDELSEDLDQDLEPAGAAEEYNNGRVRIYELIQGEGEGAYSWSDLVPEMSPHYLNLIGSVELV